ncbi:Amidohydrolase [compost metagenome]
MDHCINVFGTDRIIFGSDWPVCLLAASYEEVLAITEDHLHSSLNQEEIDKIFGGNAMQFYKWQENN